MPPSSLIDLNETTAWSAGTMSREESKSATSGGGRSKQQNQPQHQTSTKLGERGKSLESHEEPAPVPQHSSILMNNNSNSNNNTNRQVNSKQKRPTTFNDYYLESNNNNNNNNSSSSTNSKSSSSKTAVNSIPISILSSSSGQQQLKSTDFEAKEGSLTESNPWVKRESLEDKRNGDKEDRYTGKAEKENVLSLIEQSTLTSSNKNTTNTTTDLIIRNGLSTSSNKNSISNSQSNQLNNTTNNKVTFDSKLEYI